MKSSFEPMPLSAHNDFVASPPLGAPAPVAVESVPDTQEYDRGYAAARAELEAETQRGISTAVQALEGAARELRELHSLEREALGEAVLELGLIVAERLVLHELQNDAEALAPLIAEALERLGTGDALSIQLSPAEAARVLAGEMPEIESLRARWGAEIVSEASLAPGEARVRSGAASIDLRLKALLENFRQSFAEQLPQPEVAT